ncbi:hypothetical protein SADUNF_Sadunf16G0064800 [Salix dunnii]|uniref:Uncharacterized protein n=1 Tax=Salix dunnii TaxID=1413687 RepID=A0A835J7B9_9ROSI|nr:hypothetical protein SADUNF_Sadunf16G0064800 [Salix dunnii]
MYLTSSSYDCTNRKSKSSSLPLMVEGSARSPKTLNEVIMCPGWISIKRVTHDTDVSFQMPLNDSALKLLNTHLI